jgi:hypothetical protein
MRISDKNEMNKEYADSSMRISDMRMKNKAVLIDSSMRISMKLE